MTLLRAIATRLAEAVWVEICSSCGRRGAWVCPACLSDPLPTGIPACQRCGVSTLARCECSDLPDELDAMRGAYPYAGWVRTSVHQFKFAGEFARAGYLADALAPLVDPRQADVLVPVPMHPNREQRRGYNQAVLLARELSVRSGIGIAETALVRTVSRAPQVGRDRASRQHAIRGVFAPGTMSIAGMRVVVVDDVITTGATVGECARVLIGAGAASVHAVAIARD